MQLLHVVLIQSRHLGIHKKNHIWDLYYTFWSGIFWLSCSRQLMMLVIKFRDGKSDNCNIYGKSLSWVDAIRTLQQDRQYQNLYCLPSAGRRI